MSGIRHLSMVVLGVMGLFAPVGLPAVAAAPAGTASSASEAPAAAPAEVAPVAAPVRMMRTLQLMQDQIAAGSVAAHTGQRGLLAIFNQRFLDLPDSTWQDRRNIDAAVIFTLSGGSPAILRKLISPRLVPIEALPVVEGTLAYVEGREGEARRALMPVQAATLPLGLGAQIALVQAALIVRADPRKSMKLLDFVRLHAPGTLLEEGALRRQVFVASQLADNPALETLVNDYLRRYRSSIYAGNFRQKLSGALVKVDFAKDPDRFARIVDALAGLNPETEKSLYLIAAKASVQAGRFKSALMASEKALRLSDGDEAGSAQARLYHAAAMISDPKSLSLGIDELISVDRALLSGEDKRLLDDALATGKRIRELPRSRKDLPKANAIVAETEQVQAAAQPPALTKAQEALQRVDRLIRN